MVKLVVTEKQKAEYILSKLTRSIYNGILRAQRVLKKGSHSALGVATFGPAVFKFLIEDGSCEMHK